VEAVSGSVVSVVVVVVVVRRLVVGVVGEVAVDEVHGLHIASKKYMNACR